VREGCGSGFLPRERRIFAAERIRKNCENTYYTDEQKYGIICGIY
jgi:hypothetical protein